jgi:hypothetical protein
MLSIKEPMTAAWSFDHGGSAVAQRRQGVAKDLKGATGEVSGKEERAGAHRNDVLKVRWFK